MNDKIVKDKPKFTRGEKCLFSHLVITFSVILSLLLLYLVHLYLVNHSVYDVFNTRRSLIIHRVEPKLDGVHIGVIFLNEKVIKHIICNTHLLTAQWSIGPGHCIAMQADPNLSDLIDLWRINYRYNPDLRIKRGIVHPHFNRNSFENNIGLVQHITIHGVQEFNKIDLNNNFLKPNELDDIVIVSWDHNTLYQDKLDMYPVRLMDIEQCNSYLGQITEMRTYEYCIILRKFDDEIFLGHGASIINKRNNQVLGIFTWGEREKWSLPLVVLNITHFYEWLNIVSL